VWRHLWDRVVESDHMAEKEYERIVLTPRGEALLSPRGESRARIPYAPVGNAGHALSPSKKPTFSAGAVGRDVGAGDARPVSSFAEEMSLFPPEGSHQGATSAQNSPLKKVIPAPSSEGRRGGPAIPPRPGRGVLSGEVAPPRIPGTPEVERGLGGGRSTASSPFGVWDDKERLIAL
jgi:hypothetical protein